MSQKITGKNLHYDKSLPPFLARMRGEAPDNSDSPDPRLAMNRQKGKARSGSAEAEDAPVVLDEEGNVLSDMKVGLDGSVQSTAQVPTETEEAEASGGPADKGKQQEAAKEAGKGASIGAARKRKVGKVVGGDDDAEDDDQETRAPGKMGSKSETAPPKNDKESTGVIKATKKKAKKIKLSFGDDEG